MLDNATIITKGGLALWSYSAVPLKGNPISALIRTVLLEDRGAEKHYQYENYTLKWTFANDFDIVIIAVHQTQFIMHHVDEILQITKQKFTEMFASKLKNKETLGSEEFDFTQEFKNIVRAVEIRQEQKQETAKLVKKGYEKKPKKPKQQQQEDAVEEPEQSPQEENTYVEETSPQSPSSNVDPKEETLSKEEVIRRNREKLRAGQLGKKKPAEKQQPQSLFGSTSSTVTPSPPPKKQQTVWQTGEYSASAAKSLNMNKSEAGEEFDRFKDKFLPEDGKKVDLQWDIEKDDEEEVDEKNYEVKSEKKKGGMFSFFSSLTGGRELTQEDLEPVLLKFKEGLMSKNVAIDIAAKICESVGASLVGKKLGTFSSVSSTIYAALEEALTRILTPKRKIDVLREIIAAREQGRPYVMVMVGVNGVGKSTSLAKISYWLQQNNLSVMIAACDTFRSGAIEQLAVHAKCLKVQLYQKGYQKDAAAIAKEAIMYAEKNGIDVVMVDTAGRMQDNEPLMRSLCKVIHVNNPDLVLFVGEALVGNDGVDQLVKFNDSLTNLSTSGEYATTKSNLIDGIVLTKFDTIDDKVGAAISMVYTTGHPIVFVGVGQTYPDLKSLSVKAVVRSLLK